jgi:hypothetical protein
MVRVVVRRMVGVVVRGVIGMPVPRLGGGEADEGKRQGAQGNDDGAHGAPPYLNIARQGPDRP